MTTLLVKNRVGKMPNKYDTYHDLEARLSGCVVRYKDKPFHCAIQPHPSGGLKGQILLYKFGDTRVRESMEVQINDPDLDISSIELGYFNIGDNVCLYAMRPPARRYKQGIYPDHVTWKAICGRATSEGSRNLFHRAGVFDGLCGVYPAIQEALGTDNGHVAISPDVAVENMPISIALVYCRMHLVGYVDKRSHELILRNDIDWVSKKYVTRFDWRF